MTKELSDRLKQARKKIFLGFKQILKAHEKIKDYFKTFLPEIKEPHQSFFSDYDSGLGLFVNYKTGKGIFHNYDL